MPTEVSLRFEDLCWSNVGQTPILAVTQQSLCELNLVLSVDSRLPYSDTVVVAASKRVLVFV